MYMRKIIYQMPVGCYIVAALVLVAACNDKLDIQTRYPFTVETMPVPKKTEGERNGGNPLRTETGRTVGRYPVHYPVVPL